MSALLEKAPKVVVALPEDEQDAIASQILASVADEDAWKQRFAGSQRDAILRMAQEALEEDAGAKRFHWTICFDPVPGQAGYPGVASALSVGVQLREARFPAFQQQSTASWLQFMKLDGNDDITPCAFALNYRAGDPEEGQFPTAGYWGIVSRRASSFFRIDWNTFLACPSSVEDQDHRFVTDSSNTSRLEAP